MIVLGIDVAKESLEVTLLKADGQSVKDSLPTPAKESSSCSVG